MERPTLVLNALFGSAVVVSIVHYADNTVRFADYAPEPGLVSRPVIPLAWVAFTAFGVWGYVQYRRGRAAAAALGLAVYSGSGLVGMAHYATVSPSDLDAFQNTFVVVDVVLGAGVLAFACWLALRGPGATRGAPVVRSGAPSPR